METINQLSRTIMGVINVGAIFRIIYCCIVKNSDPQTSHIMNKRIKHIILFVAVADSIFALSQVATYYWG